MEGWRGKRGEEKGQGGEVEGNKVDSGGGGGVRGFKLQ